MNPLARKNDLIVEKVTPELFIHDLKENKFICLNPTSAYIWEKCDGKHSKQEIAKDMQSELGLTISERLIEMTLARLQSDCLLETSYVV